MDEQDIYHGMEWEEQKPCILSIAAVYSAAESNTENEQTESVEEPETPKKERLTTTADIISLANLNGYFGENVDFEDFYETQHYTLICRISEKFYESIKNILEHRAVGVAFEGQNLGRDGTLSLVQIATDSEVIIFDIVRLGNEAFEAGLRTVFESDDVMKVIHDCRWIADLLRYQHEISMTNIFDTQVANAFVCRSLSGGKWPNNVDSLPVCLNNYLNLPPQDVNFSQITEHNNEDNEKVWLVRPLPFELLDAATDNAIHLLKLQRILLAEMLVEFKAAVNIYLNYSSGTPEDMKTYRATKHLLPIAITYIHTFIKGKSGSKNMTDRQSSNKENFETLPDRTEALKTENLVDGNPNLVAESQDLLNTQSEPSKVQAAANRRKKNSPRKVTRPSSQKSKGFYRNLSKEVFSDDSSTSEWENMDIDVVKHSSDLVNGAEPVGNLKCSPESSKRIKSIEKKGTGRNAGGRRSSSPRQSTGRVRLPPRRFPCDMCEMKFPSASALSSHKATHSEERLYKCDICDKSFKTYSTLYGHKLIHTGMSALIEHKKMHTEDKPYKCPACEKTFKRNDNRNMHYKRIHCRDNLQHEVCSNSSEEINKQQKIHSGLWQFQV
ncbi:exonuclease 3'-5' domain-containing protein 1 [Elysia marginata]|uniref:Exonuclease 3'-5' domain-containing protein 1 n=1 Tax=Elysia marginata TaxID=1093978 RepID=A0AAV4H695_9GAST|nr:exonuclease 3'-5' domain-containing protein 1 [Elysia marginata]